MNTNAQTPATLHFPDILSTSPILTSHDSGWSDLSLEMHHLPKGGTPSICLDHHIIGINMSRSIDCEFEVEGKIRKFGLLSGEMNIMPAGYTFSTYWNREISATTVNLSKQLLNRNAVELCAIDQVELIPRLDVNDPLITQIAVTLSRIVKDHQDDAQQMYVKTMANALAVHLLRNYATQETQKIRSIGPLSPRQLKHVLDYINASLEHRIELRELAALTELSQYYFARSFKQAIGVSPHQYVIQQRVERAKRLLRANRMSISEVAVAVGFSHQSHLTRHFKRLTGVTPKTFQQT
ncbi:helix-turn-helix transcriptional regulator [filamentous cyanobacterium LEGE 11480]|uniref:Helix-turn-helix transcriptional regulator n=1 Tax=Romeriopsis navalis LEGE 11480 TaxID=2777977 RepID=A0A928VMF5_9CYAN|nr:AraC family transcriptional regulator [Romeriopsis navalis]MBE9028539.1 helix-turn-helix transcriptional regulator [Romeriopsis navalis LEGE 11480]